MVLAFSIVTTPEDPDEGRPAPNVPPHVPPPPPLSESELARAAFAARPPLPNEVRISFVLWLAVGAMFVVSAVVAVAQRDQFVEAVRQTPEARDLTPEAFDAAVTASWMLAIIASAVMAGLFVLFAFQARAGRSWARVVLAVLTAVVLLFVLFGPSPWGLLIALISVAAVVLLYLPGAKAYFDAVKRNR
ncbi:hypothetical protein GCM10010492_28150 [Saccharothrix mutabilis subsp. mutabilis]|uniref:Integral membrane protein n=1 Tax=Saccharothrix mutabilis subsp. mutabilis TaxID=66855 RepID=A0ABN0TR56_9PSEU